jgi:predicted dithiol-disulfide oxidoreductase (DUF899 family)
MTTHKTGTRKEWLAAWRELLATEKELRARAEITESSGAMLLPLRVMPA